MQQPVRIPQTAMVFAAGLGTRMRSHRDDIPKPLVPVAGRTLIDRVLDKLVQAGIERVVMNASYRADQLIAHVEQRKDVEVVFSREEVPLETGGGLLKALPHLGDDLFYVVNSDITWVDGAELALHRLAARFAMREECHCLLLMADPAQSLGYEGKGDFVLDADGMIHLPDATHPPTHVFAGVQLMDPTMLKPYLQQWQREGDIPVFSLGTMFRQALADERQHPVQGLAHDNLWLHIGDGGGVAQAEEYYRVVV